LKIAIYILITLCGVLPIAFQRIYWVRIASLAVLAGIAVFYGLGLQTSARLAGVREYQVTQNPPSEDWIDGAYKTRRIIEELHPIGILLFVSLIALAVKPVKDE